MNRNTHLANTNKNIRNGTVECLRQIVHLGDNAVDEVNLRREALEEQVAVGRVHVRFNVDLRQVWLNDVEQLPRLACLDLLDLEVDMASLVLGRGRL